MEGQWYLYLTRCCRLTAEDEDPLGMVLLVSTNHAIAGERTRRASFRPNLFAAPLRHDMNAPLSGIR